jgi:sulfur carrier protein ThiS
MAAIKVKPIQPTVVSEISIIQDIIREATTNPSPVAVKRNKEASELLRRLQRKQVENEE